jgi:hypothetical protein
MRSFANRLFDILRHNSWLTDPALAGSVSPYHHDAPRLFEMPPTIGCSVRVAVGCYTIPGQFYRLHCFDKSLSVTLP